MGRVFFNTRKNVHALAAAYTVLASDSGKIFTIDGDNTFVISLPTTHQEGLNYEFVITDQGSGEVHIDSGTSNGIVGWSMDSTTGINAIDNNLVEIATSGTTLGDTVKVWSNGSVWICQSFCGGTNGIVGANS